VGEVEGGVVEWGEGEIWVGVQEEGRVKEEMREGVQVWGEVEGDE